MNQTTKRCFGPLRVLALAAFISTLLPEAKSQEVGSYSSSTSTYTDGTVFEDNVSDVPIDGGISILLLAGAAYGLRRVRRKQ